MGLDLVTVWTLIISFCLIIYVLADGFDLGIGLLFLGVRNKRERSSMVNSGTPLWDGNEAWLIAGGASLMVVFPLAFSVILEALYIPLLAMTFGLVLRGVALALRFRSTPTNYGTWDILICIGSLLATFFQGAVMGAVVQGFSVEDNQYVGGAWDWLNWFSILTGFSLLPAYALLGSTWLLIKSEGELYEKMRHYSHHLLVWLGYAMMIIVLITPFLTNALRERWLTLPNFFYMGFVPMLALMVYTWVYYVIRFSPWRRWPFAIVLLLLAHAYFILVTSLWPHIIPPSINAHETAASESSLRLALWGIAVFVPIILGYTCWVYRECLAKLLDK